MNDQPRETGCFDQFKMYLSILVATLVFKTTTGDVLVLRLASACLSGLAAWFLSLNGAYFFVIKTREFRDRMRGADANRSRSSFHAWTERMRPFLLAPVSDGLFFAVEFTVSFLIATLVYLIAYGLTHL